MRTLRKQLGYLRDTPGVHFRHAARQLRGQFPSREVDVLERGRQAAMCNMRVIYRAWWGPRRRRGSGGMWASRRLVQALREQGVISPPGLRSRGLGITFQPRLASRRAQLGGTIR